MDKEKKKTRIRGRAWEMNGGHISHLGKQEMRALGNLYIINLLTISINYMFPKKNLLTIVIF